MSTHVTGPVLMGDEAEPHRFVADLYKADSSVLKAAGVAKLWLHGNLALTLVDRKASFVAADAKKQVEMLKKLREHLHKPELKGVLILGTFQKICSKTDTAERARCQLVNNGISVYRLSTIA